MQQLNLFTIFLEPLNKSDIPYMVTGAVAAIAYGEPRLTHDIDIVLDIQTDNIGSFVKMFTQDKFYCPPQETIQSEIANNRGHFKLSCD